MGDLNGNSQEFAQLSAYGHGNGLHKPMCWGDWTQMSACRDKQVQTTELCVNEVSGVRGRRCECLGEEVGKNSLTLREI